MASASERAGERDRLSDPEVPGRDQRRWAERCRLGGLSQTQTLSRLGLQGKACRSGADGRAAFLHPPGSDCGSRWEAARSLALGMGQGTSPAGPPLPRCPVHPDQPSPAGVLLTCTAEADCLLSLFPGELRPEACCSRNCRATWRACKTGAHQCSSGCKGHLEKMKGRRSGSCGRSWE